MVPPVRGVLLDRDGVLDDNPEGYVYTWEEFVFLPRVLDALARLHALGIAVAVVTNQSVVNRGELTLEVLTDIHRRMCAVICAHGGALSADAVFVCPHTPEEGCACRKPGTGNLFRALDHLRLAPEECCFVGDRFTDVQAAHAAGMRGYLVQTGASFEVAEALAPPISADGVFSDLAEFVSSLPRPAS